MAFSLEVLTGVALICSSVLEPSMLSGVGKCGTSLPILLAVCEIAVNTAGLCCCCSPLWSDLRAGQTP